MDEILRRLQAIESLLWTILGFMAVFVTAVIASISSRDNAFVRLLPRVRDYAKRGVYNLTVGKLKNLGGTKTTPDVPPDLEIRFAQWIYKRIHADLELDFREIALESVMDEFGCPNKNTLQKLLARFEGLGVLEKKTSAKNSTRKLARDGYGKLKNLLPTPASPTAKKA